MLDLLIKSSTSSPSTLDSSSGFFNRFTDRPHQPLDEIRRGVLTLAYSWGMAKLIEGAIDQVRKLRFGNLKTGCVMKTEQCLFTSLLPQPLYTQRAWDKICLLIQSPVTPYWTHREP
jgi:hypothetical protein